MEMLQSQRGRGEDLVVAEDDLRHWVLAGCRRAVDGDVDGAGELSIVVDLLVTPSRTWKAVRSYLRCFMQLNQLGEDCFSTFVRQISDFLRELEITERLIARSQVDGEGEESVGARKAREQLQVARHAVWKHEQRVLASLLQMQAVAGDVVQKHGAKLRAMDGPGLPRRVLRFLHNHGVVPRKSLLLLALAEVPAWKEEMAEAPHEWLDVWDFMRHSSFQAGTSASARSSRDFLGTTPWLCRKRSTRLGRPGPSMARSFAPCFCTTSPATACICRREARTLCSCFHTA
jgi:hypothetical protein